MRRGYRKRAGAGGHTLAAEEMFPIAGKKDFKFDKRAAAYDDGFEGRLSRKFYTALLSQVKLSDGDNVLDVGCGTGQLLKKMAELSAVNGYGIDVEENMIAQARAKCPGMDIRLSACESTPFDDDTFDVLTACMAYHHFADKDGFAREAGRITRTGGWLFVADPRFPFVVRKSMNGILKLHKITGEFFTPEEIAARFKDAGFEPASVFSRGYVQVVGLRKVK